MAFVLDASMTLAWYFEDESAPDSETIFARTDAETIHVPQHWFAELSNAFLVGERRRRATPRDSADFIESLAKRHIVVDDLAGTEVFDRILPLARAHRLTAYDAIYLELAERLGVPLATLDAELADAARSVGIETLGK
jgi:predicted nucleic acid-binding protein